MLGVDTNPYTEVEIVMTMTRDLSGFPIVRPDFGPTQVLSKKDLVIGRRYIAHSGSSADGEDFTLEGLIDVIDGILWIDVEYDSGPKMRESLRDHGVDPYIVDGVKRWHVSNWLEDTTK
jgi:hypothetical protein